MRDNKFFQFVSNIWLTVESEPKHKWIMNSSPKPEKRVHFAEPKVLRLIRKFGKIKAEIPYVAKFNFKYSDDIRYCIVLTANGDYQIFKNKVDTTQENGSKILKEFFEAFYIIDVETILQKIINFPPERAIPPKLRLNPLQQNVFLSTMERELNNGKNDGKIVIVSHSKMIKDFQLIPPTEFRNFLKERFTGSCQILLDYEELVNQPQPKKPNKKNSNFKSKPKKPITDKKSNEK